MKKKKNVSLRDIAKVVKADVGTVSRALSDSQGVGAKRAAEIKAVAKSMGYSPKPFRRKKTNAIGLIVRSWNEAGRNIDAGYTERILSYVEQEAANRGLHTHMHVMRFEDISLPPFITENRVDGIIVCGHAPREFYETSFSKMVPSVAISEEIDRTNIDSVICDPTPGISQAVTKLVKMNHKKIGILLPNMRFLTVGKKYLAYKDALAMHGIQEQYSQLGLPLGFRGGQEGAENFMESRDLPTAILTNDDLIALGAIYAFARKGIYTPEDITVVSYDNTTMASEITPPLPSIDNKEKQTVRTAFDMLAERISGLSSPPRQITLNSELIWR